MVRASLVALLLVRALVAPAPARAEGILDSLGCIARAVYWEARDQPFDGQLGVAFVVLNRMRTSGKTACAVVGERGSFLAIAQHGHARGRDAGAWGLAQEAALIAWQEPDADPTGAATYFHRLDVRPAWAQSLTFTRRIGTHLFFRAREAAEAAPSPSTRPAALAGKEK